MKTLFNSKVMSGIFAILKENNMYLNELRNNLAANRIDKSGL